MNVDMQKLDELLCLLGRKYLGDEEKISDLMRSFFSDNMEERIELNRKNGAKIGMNVFMDYGVWCEPPFAELIEIEDNVVISAFVKLVGHDSALTNIVGFPVRKGKILLKKNAFIGNGAIILPGVTIGEEAVIGAGSVVTEDVSPRTVVAGVPAKKISDFKTFFEKNIELLKKFPGRFTYVFSKHQPKPEFIGRSADYESGVGEFGVLPRALPFTEHEKALLSADSENSDPAGHNTDDNWTALLDFAGVGENSRVIDIGCGNGSLVLECAKRGANVVGVDFSEAALGLAREKTFPTFQKNVNFICTDLKSMNQPEKSFDAVFVTNVVEYLQAWELEILFHTIKKMLKDGGKFVIYSRGK